jgi:predicted nucleic acid-binding protein
VSPLYVADTNVYLTAAVDPAFRERLSAFVREHGPLRVSAVVAAETLIGVPDPRERDEAVQGLEAGAQIMAPDVDDWVRAAGAVAQLGGEAATKSRSFWNDALLAAQCARLGATLLTHNVADFQRLGRYLPVQAVAPFP